MLLFPMIYYFNNLDKHNDQKNKLYFIIVATLLCPTSLYAQSGTDKRSVLVLSDRSLPSTPESR